MAKILSATNHDIGGLDVKRILPNFEKKMVGPFIFFDHMGPNHFPIGQGLNVRPHPHIGLATLTYLFSGSILHRDSLGNNLEIQPGDVNWMTAGRGIVHSERESFEVRANPHDINGLQCWIALPENMAEIAPSFQQVKKQLLPQLIHEGVMMRLIAGEAYGLSSPIKTYSAMFYIDVVGDQGSVINTPNPLQETALYVIYGQVSIAGAHYHEGDFILFDQHDQHIEFSQDARFILLGGSKFNKVPYLHWNFVAYSKERIEQAKQDWQAQRFAKIPGDDQEFIPL
ncbi:pirin family protein [Pseudoalteromonas mariniglutinosa]|uniref:pirin family protein n=1 Tax=Pseudoalteromonas mariniglutinosa TaxID=206042 RepID=UPI00384B5BAC